MELTHQQNSLLEELIMAPKLDTSFSNEFLQNNWNYNFTEFDQTPDLHFPITNPSSFLELNCPNCPFGEFQPFLDALTNSQDQLIGSIYENDDLPSMSIQEDALFLDNCINGFDVGFKFEGDATMNMDRTINVDLYGQKKSKSKKPDGQLITNPSSFLELNCPNCPFGEFQPFIDALTNSQDQLIGSIYENDDLPPMSIQEDALFLDNCINGFDVGFKFEGDATMNMDRTINVDLYGQKKSKSKKPDGQPSKNLMAERRRRKRLNDRLSMLRSIVPKISKMDRTSILGDTIDYTRELLDKIQKLREEGQNDQIDLIEKTYLKDVMPNEMQIRNPPTKFDVERRSKETRVEVCCTSKPGLLLSTLSTLDVLGLEIQQCVISCFNDFSLQASCYETPEQRSICTEDVKQALFRTAGYGGRCL